jgi:acetyl esterase/lipase
MADVERLLADLGVASLSEMRDGLEALAAAVSTPPPVHNVEDGELDLPGRRIALRTYQPAPGPRAILMWFHGGGYVSGSLTAIDATCRELAVRAHVDVISVGYRLAPEHPYPAALQDVTAAYRALAGQAGSAGHVVVSGESAGGNLAIELLIAGQAEGLTMPAAALLLSPMTDLTVTGSSYAGKAHADPAISAQAIRTRAADYLAGTDPADPLVSPIFADLSGLPPLLIQAGSHEVLLDDATRLAVKAAADDVAVILDITPGVPHVFQAFAALLDEGDAALNRVARFVRDNTAQKAAA